MTEASTCPNCHAVLKDGMFGSNLALSRSAVSAINLAFGEERKAACGKCGGKELQDAALRLDDRIRHGQARLLDGVSVIPLVSIPKPPGWEFSSLGLVTAQSVTGTGIFSDVTSAFTDLFGAQSNAYNSKIRHGEDLCRASLRLQALEAGGNAVAGVDVDYAEVGGQRAMLMVCMTGTAVSICNAAETMGAAAKTIDEMAALHASISHAEKVRGHLG